MPQTARFLAIGALLMLTGCTASLRDTAPMPPLTTASGQTRQCLQWFEELDRATSQARVTDAEFERIAGFPYLRVNRHALALGGEAVTPRQQTRWVQRLRILDQQARQTEVANLPDHALAELLAGATAGPADQHQRERVLAHASDCGRQLTGADARSSARLATLRASVTVADRYATGLRALGLYPLTRLGVSAGVRRWEAETQARFRAGADDATRHAGWPAYGLPAPPSDPASLFARISLDALGVPQLDPQLEQQLLAAYAPVFLIEQQSAADAPGSVALDANGLATVQPDQPTLYWRTAFTRYRGRSLIQLVYTLWFPERPAAGALDIYAGRLDGVVLRVTLNWDGRPVVVDTIHPCGCYHQFFTTADVALRDRPLSIDPRNEWRYLPGRALTPGPGKRLEVAIEAATHYVVGVRYGSADSAEAAGRQPVNKLVLRPERSLTRLPRPQGGPSQSLYGGDGLVKGTERAERWILWPMGIASAGAMRQWGHHATAFVGRRHFDDARLIESRFVLP